MKSSKVISIINSNNDKNKNKARNNSKIYSNTNIIIIIKKNITEWSNLSNSSSTSN